MLTSVGLGLARREGPSGPALEGAVGGSACTQRGSSGKVMQAGRGQEDPGALRSLGTIWAVGGACLVFIGYPGAQK